MYRPQSLRQAAFTLRAVGVALMAVSIGAGLFSGALAQVAPVQPVPGLGTPIPDTTPTLPPTPPPVGERSSKTPPPQSDTGGPLRLRLTGNLTLGEHGFASDRSGVLTGSNLATENAGFLMQIERRTALSSLTFGIPMGVSSGSRSMVGQVQLGYYTPHYGLQYAPQPLSALGGVPINSSMPAIALVLPLRGGDLTLYQGGGFLGDLESARLYGVRARKMLGSTLGELGIVDAVMNDGSGSARTAIAGFANQVGKANQIFEAAWQVEHLADRPASSANAFQYLLNYGGSAAYTTLNIKHTSPGFESLGGGALQGDDQVSGAYHIGDLSVQESFDRIDDAGAVSLSRSGALTFNRTIGKAHPVSMLWQLGDQRVTDFSGAQWIGTAGLQVGTGLGDMTALFGITGTRSASSAGSPLGSMTYQSTFQKPVAGFLAQFQLQHMRTTGADSDSIIDQANFGATRQFGRTAITIAENMIHTLTPASNQWQGGPLLTVQHRLTPALALGISYGLQMTRDVLNPNANGTSRLFNVQLNAPFALGSGVVQGHANPKLPATISGTVTTGIGNQSAFAASVTSGVANVAVILDGTQIQRTDLAGHYQFSMVPSGRHTLQLDLTSLPRGVTPDQPVASISVLGGQEGSVNFEIGSYGAIGGKVMGRDSSGNLVPVDGVVLSLDKDGGLATTTANGEFGFGKLTPGTHTVTIQEQSLPATVALTQADLTRSVSVRAGEISDLDFVANSLGSIAGFIVFDPSLAPDFQGGAFNSYVVAEPGDYAAIADQDGSFLMDNLPPGTYTLDVDPETVPPNTGNVAGPQTFTIAPGQHVEGVRFLVGHQQKAVVFSFKTTESASSQAQLQRSSLPPGGATEITIDAGKGARNVAALAFGMRFPLTFENALGRWAGTVAVPARANAGTENVKIAVNGATHYTTSVVLTVDPAIPLATFVTTPRRPAIGQYAYVRARMLADVHTGDTIKWADGQTTRLGAPLSGRVFGFTVKISVHPLHGILLTRQGELPILLP